MVALVYIDLDYQLLFLYRYGGILYYSVDVLCINYEIIWIIQPASFLGFAVAVESNRRILPDFQVN